MEAPYSITCDGTKNRLVVNTGTFDEPVIEIYGPTQKAAYLEKWPDRAGDFAALEASSPPVLTVEQARAAKLVALAAERWEREVAGIVIGGLTIKTDRESQAALTSAYVSLKYGLIPSTPWKGEDGWAVVTLPQLEPIAEAVALHVSSCFANEKTHADAIAALPDDAGLIDAYDISTGWPGGES
jgi:hypothetical protein